MSSFIVLWFNEEFMEIDSHVKQNVMAVFKMFKMRTRESVSCRFIRCFLSVYHMPGLIVEFWENTKIFAHIEFIF